MNSFEPLFFEIVEGIIQYNVSICPSVAKALNLEAVHVRVSRCLETYAQLTLMRLCPSTGHGINFVGTWIFHSSNGIRGFA